MKLFQLFYAQRKRKKYDLKILDKRLRVNRFNNLVIVLNELTWKIVLPTF